MSFNLERRISRINKDTFVKEFRKTNHINNNMLVSFMKKRADKAKTDIVINLNTKYAFCLAVVLEQFQKARGTNGEETNDSIGNDQL
jgi:hypothetical protein